jgi:hypothetical protein
MLIQNNQNELAFQLWWFVYYDRGCACVPHAFSFGLKKTTSYSMSLRTMICGGERSSMQEMQKKETVKQSCSNKVASLAQSAFARFTRAPGTLPGDPGNFSA